MTTTDQLHTNIKTILQSAMREQSITYTQLIAATGLDMTILSNAIGYGIVHLCDYVAITHALGLDASAVLAEAVNHIGAKLAPNKYPPTHPPIKPTAPIKINLPVNAWQIGTRPDHSRFVEIHLHGADLLAHYIDDRDGYLIGHDTLIPAEQVPRWREADESQLDQLNQDLAQPISPLTQTECDALELQHEAAHA